MTRKEIWLIFSSATHRGLGYLFSRGASLGVSGCLQILSTSESSAFLIYSHFIRQSGKTHKSDFPEGAQRAIRFWQGAVNQS